MWGTNGGGINSTCAAQQKSAVTLATLQLQIYSDNILLVTLQIYSHYWTCCKILLIQKHICHNFVL